MSQKAQLKASTLFFSPDFSAPSTSNTIFISSFSTPVTDILNGYLKRSQDIEAGCPNRGFPFAVRSPLQRLSRAYLK
jgi:hypothetical protein